MKTQARPGLSFFRRVQKTALTDENSIFTSMAKALSGVNGSMWANYMQSVAQTETVQSSNSFKFDKDSGFYKDVKAQLYYDPNSTYFFTLDYKKYFVYDSEVQLLCLVDSQGKKVPGGETRPLPSQVTKSGSRPEKLPERERPRSFVPRWDLFNLFMMLAIWPLLLGVVRSEAGDCMCCSKCGCTCASSCPGYKAPGCAGAPDCLESSVWGNTRYTEETWCGQAHITEGLTDCRCCAECGCACGNTCPGYKAYGCAGASNCEVNAVGANSLFTEEEWCSRGLPGEQLFAKPAEVMAQARERLASTLNSMDLPHESFLDAALTSSRLQEFAFDLSQDRTSQDRSETNQRFQDAPMSRSRRPRSRSDVRDRRDRRRESEAKERDEREGHGKPQSTAKSAARTSDFRVEEIRHQPIHFPGGDPLAKLANAQPLDTSRTPQPKKKKKAPEGVLGLAASAPLQRPGPVTVFAARPVTQASPPSPPPSAAAFVPPVPSSPSMTSATTPALDWICEVCMRKFSSEEALRKHEQLSELHKQNLMKLGV
eukprot:symbB.v1.2.035372.t1/scaffold4746.1/size59667/2